MTSRFRLTSTAFKREDEDNKIDPKRMIILSVEGDETERTYFQHLNMHLDRTMIQIEVLRHRRGDGYSDPRHVIELLNEYVDIRQGQLIPEELPESFAEKYSREIIDAYLKTMMVYHQKLVLQSAKRWLGLVLIWNIGATCRPLTKKQIILR